MVRFRGIGSNSPQPPNTFQGVLGNVTEARISSTLVRGSLETKATAMTVIEIPDDRAAKFQAKAAAQRP